MQLPVPQVDRGALQAASGKILDGAITLAKGAWRWDGSDASWFVAPDTGTSWPTVFFGSIHYREGNPFGDVRILWEPARLQQLVDMALLARISDSPIRSRAMHSVEAQLVSWAAANPPLQGPHYISAMECALRLIAVCHATDLLRDQSLSPASWGAVCRIVSSHAPLISGRLSMYSSTGNHTVAEAAGLVYAGLLFPELPDSGQWRRIGTDLLAELSETQVLPDGGGVEQAFTYHLFNIELFSLVEALLDHHQAAVPREIVNAIERGRVFLGAMKSFSAELPQVGDSDDGHALSRFTRIPSGSINVPNPAVFNDSGYSVVPIATRPSTGFVLDHGPLGMPPSFGHGHADALSLLLWIGGQEIFIDPGTCTYTRNPELRKYFRGTRAHNTVTVDNRDQAIHESTFIWSHQYGTRLIAADLSEQASGKMLAQHDGYDRIGVRHVRGVGWSCDRWLLIWDHLSGEGNHELVLHWHLGIPPSWVDAERLLLDIDGDQLTVHCSGGSISTVYGEDTPTLGWRSRGYGTREPAPTVRARYIGSLPHTFTTLVTFPSIELMAHDIDDMVQWFRDQVQ